MAMMFEPNEAAKNLMRQARTIADELQDDLIKEGWRFSQSGPGYFDVSGSSVMFEIHFDNVEAETRIYTIKVIRRLDRIQTIVGYFMYDNDDFWQPRVNRFIKRMERGEQHSKPNCADDIVIVNNNWYTISDEPSAEALKRARASTYGNSLGYGGARFDIEFDDGTTVTSHNLWHGGKIPPKYRDYITNNAKFRS
jgi:hypothetical protein